MAYPQARERIAIFRALDVRVTHAEFAGAFNKLDPLFIANMPPDVKKYLSLNHIPYYDLKLHPALGFDPVFPLLKKTDFTPWQQFNQNRLEEITKDVKVFEIYEPYFFYSSQIANLANKKQIPLITEIWTSFPNHPTKFIPPYSFIINNVIRKTDFFILRSKKALSYVKPFDIPENKKVVLYHGVDLKRFYPARNSHDKITILFVGALAAHKGLDDLLTVFPELVYKYPRKLQLIICGDGPMRQKVVTDSKTLPIDFRGKISNFDLPDIYRQANIYCQPSKDYYFAGVKGGEEFAGYTFMESLASGLPIITTHCGGIPEIVGDENTLIEQGNKKQLFNALEIAINNKTLRDEIGIKNRKRAEHLFDLSKQVKELENIIIKNLL